MVGSGNARALHKAGYTPAGSCKHSRFVCGEVRYGRVRQGEVRPGGVGQGKAGIQRRRGRRLSSAPSSFACFWLRIFWSGRVRCVQTDQSVKPMPCDDAILERYRVYPRLPLPQIKTSRYARFHLRKVDPVLNPDVDRTLDGVLLNRYPPPCHFET